MSSLRNSLHRRNHKERGQLAHRKRLGILEKHKDYVVRAKDYNSKKERIRKLKQNAGARNKDEFYFGMVGKKTQVRGWSIQLKKSGQLNVDPVARCACTRSREPSTAHRAC
jgi:U3 small nucleolar RNA-associated protein 11